MFLHLPGAAGALANIVSKDAARFSFGCVRCVDPEDGTYRLEATDGRRLAVLRGPCLTPGPEQDGGECLVLAGNWLDAFRQAGEKGVTLEGPDENRFVALTNPQTGVCVRSVPQDGRWPDTGAVIPKGAPLGRAVVNAQYLKELCELALRLCPGDPQSADKTCRLTLLFFGPGRALGLTAEGGQGQALDMLLMPLVGGEEERQVARPAPPEEEEEAKPEEDPKEWKAKRWPDKHGWTVGPLEVVTMRAGPAKGGLRVTWPAADNYHAACFEPGTKPLAAARQAWALFKPAEDAGHGYEAEPVTDYVPGANDGKGKDGGAD